MSRGVGVLVLAALLLSPAARADFKRDYLDGIEALQAGNHERAIGELESAIADNPQSVQRMRIYGMRFEPYLPHYYLGEARFRAGDCAGAVRAWREAERQQVITSLSQYESMKENQARCVAQTVDVSGLAAAARTAVGDLAGAVDRLEALKANRLLAADWRSATDWEEALSEAAAERTGLETELGQAEAAADANALESITTRAGARKRQLETVLETATTRVTALERQRDERLARERNQARVELIQAIAAARSALADPVPDEKARSLAAELRALADQGDGLDAAAAVERYRTLSRSIGGKLREFRQAQQDYRNRQLDIARRTPPPELLQAAQAYFAGRYQDTTRLLANPGQFSDPRVQVQAHLFRAAARYNLYVLAGGDDGDLLQQAASDVRSIKRLTGGYTPYLAAFSPKFMSFYETTL